MIFSLFLLAAIQFRNENLLAFSRRSYYMYIYSLFIQLFLCHGTKCVILWSIVFSRFLNEPSLNYFCRTTSGMASSWRSTICLSPTTEWRIRLMRLTAFFSRVSRSLFSCFYFGILLNSFSISRFICALASRRASAQAITSKWQLCTTSPMNTSSSAGENGFSAKNGSLPGRLWINPKNSNG